MAREIEKRMHKDGGVLSVHELYSGMSPLEVFKALKHLMSMQSTIAQANWEEWIYEFYGISRAHLRGGENRRAWIGRALEDRGGDNYATVGLLLETVYGTVGESHEWAYDYGQHLKE